MSYIIVSNNDMSLPEALQTQHKHVTLNLIQGNIKDVVFAARELLLQGYILVADPLAGRLERPSPYVSFFLKKSENTPKIHEEILRIEYFVALFHDHQKHFEELDQRHRHDFALIDTSLIINCVKQIFGQ